MRKDIIYKEVADICRSQAGGPVCGADAMTIAGRLGFSRSNVSFDLNRLTEEGRLVKLEGRPVRYRTVGEAKGTEDIFSHLVGHEGSLKKAIEQAKAAVIYPPRGLHTLILGQSGTGKSLLAEYVYRFYMREKGGGETPFVRFNCADYANNPQMLMSALFGVKKGAYTGADRDRPGLVDEADGGILFLDEVHRLPPEGQEMLFSLMDHGEYRPMGDSTVKKAEILIICATTESIESSLLRTFVRRIPMVITLPPLYERPLKERLELIKEFFSEESLRIKKDIGVTQNTMRALLLCRFTENVGELKNDIQIACARAFLQSLEGADGMIEVHTSDLSEKVKRALRGKNGEEREASRLLADYGDRIIFGAKTGETSIAEDNPADLYELIEKKRRELKKRGADEADVESAIGAMIDNYFDKYKNGVDEQDISSLNSVVDEKLVGCLKEFMDYASAALGRRYGTGLLYGLAIHVSSTVNRLERSLPITCPSLDEIKRKHPDEYNAAKKINDYLKGYTSVTLPDDELGYITRFLISEEDEEDEVSVVVAMHGNSAASSIADVVNKLLLNDIVAGYDMSLDYRPEDSIDDLAELIGRRENGKGTILMVDMGSLCYFGDTISQRTGIDIKTVDMVSTPMVLGAAEKSLRGNSLQDVYDSVFTFGPFVGRLRENPFKEKQGGLIICCCATGEGTAMVVKKYIERNLSMPEGIDVMPMEFDGDVINERLESLDKDFDILAVVSSFEFTHPDYPVITVDKIFGGQAMTYLQDIVNRYLGESGLMETMGRVIKENVDMPDVQGFIAFFGRFADRLKREQGIELPANKTVGLALHMACSVERIVKAENGPVKGYDRNKAMLYQRETGIIKELLQPLEELYDIDVPEEEVWAVTKIVYSL